MFTCRYLYYEFNLNLCVLTTKQGKNYPFAASDLHSEETDTDNLNVNEDVYERPGKLDFTGLPDFHK